MSHKAACTSRDVRPHKARMIVAAPHRAMIAQPLPWRQHSVRPYVATADGGGGMLHQDAAHHGRIMIVVLSRRAAGLSLAGGLKNTLKGVCEAAESRRQPLLRLPPQPC